MPSTLGTVSSSYVGIDNDVIAYVVATGVADIQTINALGGLVAGLKSAGIWAILDAIYPFVGSTATTHQFNLKDPRDLDAAFRLTYHGTVAHDATGMTGDGLTGWADTHWIPSAHVTSTNASMGLYSRSNTGAVKEYDMGASDAASTSAYMISTYFSTTNKSVFALGNTALANQFNPVDSTGLFIANRPGNNTVQGWRNNSLLGSGTDPGNACNTSVSLMAINVAGTTTRWSSREQCFAFMGQTLSSGQIASLTTLVQTYLVAMADIDAQSFLTAAGISDTNMALATSALAIGLKSTGLWSKLNAVYPVVGGTGSTHKFNLKNPADSDAAFRVTLAGGWTHSTTGMQADGSTSYGDTHWIPSVQATATSASFGMYCRTNTVAAGNNYDMGCSDAADQHASICISRYNNGQSYCTYGTETYNSTTTVADSFGFWMTNRNGASNTEGWHNGVKIIDVADTVTPTAFSMYLGGDNHGGTLSYPTNKQYGFWFLGTGLTAQNCADLYTVVQAYQTALGRNV